MPSPLSPALERISRRAMLGAGTVALLTPVAHAADQCRPRGYRSNTSCAEQCVDPVLALDCQAHGAFPTEDDISSGAITGAILGGVIAYAMGRPDLALGAVVAGGVIGGVLAGRDQYIRYQVARAGGHLPRAFEETRQNRRAGEVNISLMAFAVEALQVAEMQDVLAVLQGDPEEISRSIRRRVEGAVERIEARAGLLGSTHTNGAQTLDVQDGAEAQLAQSVSARPGQRNQEARRIIASRGDPNSPPWALYAQLHGLPQYLAMVGD